MYKNLNITIKRPLQEYCRGLVFMIPKDLLSVKDLSVF